MSISQSLTNSSVASNTNYKHIYQKIITGDRSLLSHSLNHDSHDYASNSEQNKRLTFKQIQNITKSMMKDKKAHQHNLGVLQNIKGKMYCLKLGQVSNFKEFSHYFYTSQYRRNSLKTGYKQTLPNTKLLQQRTQYSAKGQPHTFNKKISTQPSQNMQIPSSNKTSMFCYEDNQQQIKKIQEVEQVQKLQIDQKLKEKINRLIVLPVLEEKDKDKGKQAGKEAIKKDKNGKFSKENKRAQLKQAGRRYSISRML